MIRNLCFIVLLLVLQLTLSAQTLRPMSTYTVSTKVSPECVSMISLTLFEEGSGNDSLNHLIIEECLGNFLQSKHLQKLSFFYQQRQFMRDSSFDFNIWSANTFSKNDLYSFTVCPKFACDKEQVSTYETQMFTIDARNKKFVELKDIIDPAKYDSLVSFMFKVVNMYHIRSLPTCALLTYNPNQLSTNNAATTGTDVLTYQRGITHKFYFSEDKIHLYNSVKHRDYDYDDVEIALPLSKMRYFMKPEWVSRLGI